MKCDDFVNVPLLILYTLQISIDDKNFENMGMIDPIQPRHHSRTALPIEYVSYRRIKDSHLRLRGVSDETRRFRG